MRRARSSSPDADRAPHVVIVGAGFGGLTCAQALRRAPARITVVDQRNFHLFQPLLYQVATATLSPADIAVPIRHILRRCPIEVVLGRMTGIDREARHVRLDAEPHRIDYDYLVIATGAVPSYAQHPEWARVAPGLKTIEDALDIRRRMLLTFEQAANTNDARERQALMTFVVIGGGPTGVELASAIAEYGKSVLPREFRALADTAVRVVIVERGMGLLPTFSAALVVKACAALQRLNVEVLTNTTIERCDGEGVDGKGCVIESRTIVWAAGVEAPDAARWLGVAPSHAGRVEVLPELSLPGDPTVFVIGDAALIKRGDANSVPSLAAAAKQQGEYVAEVLMQRLNGRSVRAPFRYHDYGTLTTVGRGFAIADFGFLRMSGTVAWFVWAGAHIVFLVGFRNRLAVALGWAWAYVTRGHAARLITGQEPRH